MNGRAQVFEVGPRDGLQNEKTPLGLEDRVWLVESLLDAGLQKIEAGAFVRADKVPQMAQSEELLQNLQTRGFRGDGYFLVPNRKGFERAVAAGAKSIALFTAVSESFNLKNVGMTVRQSLEGISLISREAGSRGIRVRGYVSTAWGCPFAGRMDPTAVISVLDELLALPLEQVSIGDTIGVAVPGAVETLLRPILSEKERLAVHFHDTRGTALANAAKAYELGIRTFDSSIGGLGGCPFAPGASGNLATEDLVYFFKESGVETGVDYRKLCETSLALMRRMGRQAFSSKALQAYQAHCMKADPWDS